ncbi:MAG: type II CRISPR RNA-guided endonuclease Cas9 [Defluviitaleaceae bacterium]|nr:type II CRISPR RNA-guided endonuclease Cas9 [Defluviitaleaceae bacterium]MCL2275804.1 type II CRISPR RNA-guided endonuclease Cas9 [Defluviitaleaceae bacterium]
MRYSIGLDIGITSVGYAIMELEEDDTPRRILQLGSRIFDIAENPKDGSSLALPRREARGMRRRLRRKSYRKERIRNLIIEAGILTQAQLESLFAQKLPDIYALRHEALDHAITNEALARIMLHLAQRRGFLSDRRNDKNNDKEEGQLKSAVSKNKELMHDKGYRTIGEMFAADPYYTERKRNKSDYRNVVLRDMVLDEARAIFAAQRQHGNVLCTEDLEEKYIEIIASQRAFDEGPGRGPMNAPSPYAGNQIEKMVGKCTFEKDEPRAAKATYSFERFNLIQKINHIRLVGGFTTQLLNEQRLKIIEAAHKTEKLTYAKIREIIDLDPAQLFNNVKYEKNVDPNKTEVNTKFEFLPAYHAMRKALNKIIPNRISALSVSERNVIGQTLSLYKDEDKVKKVLVDAGINEMDISELMGITSFRGFGRLSTKAIDKISPFLEQGMNYDEACESAKYAFKDDEVQDAKDIISLKHLAEEAEKSITSPVVRRALSQSAKVLNAIIRLMDASPVYINIELAREMAKNFDERKKLDKSMTENNARNERIKKQIQEYGNTNPIGLDIVKFKLYEEQRNECPYSGKMLDITRLFESGYAEIDHIVPYSISFNDLYANKVLVLADENRKKGNRLPMEYLTGEQKDAFKIRINNSNLPPTKKKRLLKEVITDDERNEFHARALHDTQTMNKFLLNYLTKHLQFTPSSKFKRHVTSVNGTVTSMLRKRWGLNKIRGNGDLHHAIDAAVVACTTQAMINDLSRYYKYREERFTNANIDPRGSKDDNFPQPYPYFRDELMARLSQENPSLAVERLSLFTYPEDELAALTPVFVSRMPSRKTIGAAHKETIKGIADTGELIKKVPLSALKLNKGGEIDGYYQMENDMLLYNALKERLEQYSGKGEKAFTEPFYKPKGKGEPDRIVRSVKIVEKSTLNVPLRTPDGKIKASADNGSMIRVDVFHVQNDGYYLVPIYVSDTVKPVLPNKAILQGKPYVMWPVMNDENFMFSLYPNDLAYIKHKKGIEFTRVHAESSLNEKMSCQDAFVYYKTTGIAVGTISVINHDNSYVVKSLGIKTLLAFEKYQVDVLGNYTKVKSEKRQYFNR